MNNKQPTMTVSGINLFAVAVCLMSAKTILGAATKLPIYSDAIDTPLIVISVSLFVTDFLFHNIYTLKQLLIVVSVAIMFLYTCITCNDYNLLMNYFFIIACINRSLEYGLRLINRTKVFFVVSCVLISLVMEAITGENVLYIIKDGHICYCFGFGHSNVFGGICFWCIAEYLFLTYRRRKIITNIKMIGLFIVGTLIYILSDCLTSFIGLIILYVGIILIKYNKMPKKVLRLVSTYSIPVLGVLLFALIYTYYMRGGGLYNVALLLNPLISGRIGITAQIVDLEGISIIGKYIERGAVAWSDYYKINTIIIDGMYACFMVNIGLVYFVLLSYASIKYSKIADSMDHLVIFIYAIYGASEIMTINGYYAFPLFLIMMTQLNRQHVSINQPRTIRIRRSYL